MQTYHSKIKVPGGSSSVCVAVCRLFASLVLIRFVPPKLSCLLVLIFRSVSVEAGFIGGWVPADALGSPLSPGRLLCIRKLSVSALFELQYWGTQVGTGAPGTIHLEACGHPPRTMPPSQKPSWGLASAAHGGSSECGGDSTGRHGKGVRSGVYGFCGENNSGENATRCGGGCGKRRGGRRGRRRGQKQAQEACRRWWGGRGQCGIQQYGAVFARVAPRAGLVGRLLGWRRKGFSSSSSSSLSSSSSSSLSSSSSSSSPSC